MIVSMLKKICFMSMLVTLCVAPLSAKKNNDKGGKRSKCFSLSNKACSNPCSKPWCSRDGSDKDCKKVKDLLDRQLCSRLKQLNTELNKEFCEQNALLCSKIELLNACLEEFFISTEKASDTRIKDFITISLNEMETNVTEFTHFKVKQLEEELCLAFTKLGDLIDLLMCRIDNIDGNVDCIANVLFNFLVEANTDFGGILTDVQIAALGACIEGSGCVLTCSDASDCISPL